jgi:nucleoside phosphorylase
MGNINAAMVTAALIPELRPQNVLLVGITGAVPKQKKHSTSRDPRSFGDVLVAEQVVTYESAKMMASGIERRPFAYPAAAQLIRASRELRSDEWNSALHVPRPQGSGDGQAPTAYYGTVLCGEKVVADSVFLNEVRQLCPAAIGVEMEGFGVASACHQASPPVPFLSIKAISDFANEKKTEDWQPYASDAAAAFAAALIRRIAIMRRVVSPGLRQSSRPHVSVHGVASDPPFDSTGRLLDLPYVRSASELVDIIRTQAYTYTTTAELRARLGTSSHPDKVLRIGTSVIAELAGSDSATASIIGNLVSTNRAIWQPSRRELLRLEDLCNRALRFETIHSLLWLEPVAFALAAKRRPNAHRRFLQLLLEDVDWRQAQAVIHRNYYGVQGIRLSALERHSKETYRPGLLKAHDTSALMYLLSAPEPELTGGRVRRLLKRLLRNSEGALYKHGEDRLARTIKAFLRTYEKNEA